VGQLFTSEFNPLPPRSEKQRDRTIKKKDKKVQQMPAQYFIDNAGDK
jgi:hypothetical protein